MNTIKGNESTVLMVGARKFIFSTLIQSSSRVGWWGASQERSDFVPDRLGLVCVKKGLARGPTIKVLAQDKDAQLVEFGEEAELFPHLQKVLGLEPDRSKEQSKTPDPNGSGNGRVFEFVQPAPDMRLASQEVLDVPVGRIKRNEKQPRTFFNQERLLALGRSMLRVGQKVPVILIPVKNDPKHDYVIYDGERRWRAARLVGKPTLRAIISNTMSDAELFKGSAVCNFGREGHQPMEIARALRQIKDEEKLTYNDLAETFAMSVAWVTQHLSLLKMHPEVQALINPELPEDQQIRISVALEVAKVPYDHQVAAARHIIDHKMSLPKARHYIRHLTAQVGVSSDRRKRKPDDDYRVFAAFLQQAGMRLGHFLDLPGGDFGVLFRKRSWEDAEKAMEQIEELVAGLKRLKISIQKESKGR